VTTVIFQILQKKKSLIHTRNMVNNFGGRGGGHRPRVLGTLIYEGISLFSYLSTTQIIV